MGFEEDYRRYGAALYRLCLGYLRCSQDAEDAVQTAFVRYLQYKWNLIAIARADARYLEDILVEHILLKLDSDPFFYSIFYHELIELAPISKRSELLRQHQML